LLQDRKCHKEALCVAILNKQKCHFFVHLQNPVTGGTGPAWEEGYWWEREERGEKVWESEYTAYTVYTCKWKNFTC
jgi:hypothetical protein